MFDIYVIGGREIIHDESVQILSGVVTLMSVAHDPAALKLEAGGVWMADKVTRSFQRGSESIDSMMFLYILMNLVTLEEMES